MMFGRGDKRRGGGHCEPDADLSRCAFDRPHKVPNSAYEMGRCSDLVDKFSGMHIPLLLSCAGSLIVGVASSPPRKRADCILTVPTGATDLGRRDRRNPGRYRRS